MPAAHRHGADEWQMVVLAAVQPVRRRQDGQVVRQAIDHVPNLYGLVLRVERQQRRLDAAAELAQRVEAALPRQRFEYPLVETPDGLVHVTGIHRSSCPGWS